MADAEYTYYHSGPEVTSAVVYSLHLPARIISVLTM